MKKYCTQNNGDCTTCSLTSYGRDCHNVEVADDWLEAYSDNAAELAVLIKTARKELDRIETHSDIILEDLRRYKHILDALSALDAISVMPII